MGRQLRALALSPLVGQRLTILAPKEHYAFLERLTELIENDRLVPANRTDLPAQRDAGRHATAGSRTRARQARHHDHRPDRGDQLTVVICCWDQRQLPRPRSVRQGVALTRTCDGSMTTIAFELPWPSGSPRRRRGNGVGSHTEPASEPHFRLTA